MWGASRVIVLIIITDAVASFQLQCVLNYLSREKNEVGIVIYLGEGSENVNVFEDLVNDSRVTWTVINRHADSDNIVGTPGNYLVVAQGLDPVRITDKALRRLSTFKEIWEPSARVIVLLGPMLLGLPLPAKMYRILASRIISNMWKHSVFDAVVMFMVSDAKGGLRLFAANPFALENQCGRAVEKLIDLGCDGEAMYFEAERNVWRHPRAYPNCTFRVSRRESPPFSFLSPTGTWEGADIRFVELLGSRKNFSIVWSQRPAPESGSTLEDVHRYYENFTQNGIDLGIGGTLMNSKHIYKVAYLRPHAQVSLMYYVADAENMEGWDTLHAMFTAQVWCILGVSLLSGGISYGIVVEGTFNFKRTKFLELLAILVTQTVVLPKRWRVRIFLVVFLFPLYHISSLHSTALQSYMVHTPKQKPISTESELRALNMTVYTSASTRALISESKVHENMQISSERLFDRLVTLNRKKDYSIMARSLEVDFWRYTSHFQIHPIRPPISTFAVSLTMGKGSPYRDVLDNLAQQCLEVGLFEKWVTDLTSIQSIRPKQALHDGTALEPIDMEDVECAFLLLFVGLAISAGVFLGELFVRKCETKIQAFSQRRLDDQVKRRFKYYVMYKKGLY